MSNTEFQIVAGKAENQLFPVVVRLDDGGFVVIWESSIQESSFRIYGQRYSADNYAADGEFQISTDKNSYQIMPSAAALNDGGFVVAWLSYSNDLLSYKILAQRYDSSGNTAGAEFQINTHETINPNTDPDTDVGSSVASLNDGGFVVTWQTYGQDGTASAISGQRYDSVGNTAGAEFTINTYSQNTASGPSVTSLSDGGFVVTWESFDQDSSGDGIYGQSYDSAGYKVGNEFQINTETTNDQYNPSVANLIGGGFVVTWTSDGQDASDWGGIYGQRYDSAGIRLGTEFQINTYSQNTQTNPSVTNLSDGGFVVTWESWGQDGDTYGVYGQRYDSLGNRADNEFLINTGILGEQSMPVVTGLNDGGFFVTWVSRDDENDDGQIHGQRFDAQGNKVSVNLDVTAPDAPGVSAIAGDNILTYDEVSGFLGISGTAEPGSTITLTSDHDDNPDPTDVTTTVTDSSGNWTFTTTDLELDKDPLEDDAFILYFTATDSAGNISPVTSRTFTVNIFDPANTETFTVPVLHYGAVDGVSSFIANTSASLDLAGSPSISYSYEQSFGYSFSEFSGDTALMRLTFGGETVPIFSEYSNAKQPRHII